MNSRELDRYHGLGLRLTPQRLAILHYLDGNTRHPSAAEVFRAVSRRYPTISFATVYSTLDALKQKGLIAELSVDSAKKRFDPDPRPHHHAVCTRCGKIEDVRQDIPLPGLNRPAGFTVLRSQIEFYGLCPTCRAV